MCKVSTKKSSIINKVEEEIKREEAQMIENILHSRGDRMIN